MRILKNKYVLAALCLLLAAGFSFVLIPKMNEKTREVMRVIRVSKAIPANTEITADLLKTVEVGAFGQPSDVITDPDTIIGSFAAVDLIPTDTLTPAKLLASDQQVDGDLYGLEQRQQVAVTVTLKSLAASMAGKLQPGDIVSVYAVMPAPDGSIGHEIVMFPELELVEVLSVSNSKAADTEQKKQELEAQKSSATGIVSTKEEETIPAVITLAVDSLQAQRLIQIEASGNVHIALVGRGAAARQYLAEFNPYAAYEPDVREYAEADSSWGDYFSMQQNHEEVPEAIPEIATPSSVTPAEGEN